MLRSNSKNYFLLNTEAYVVSCTMSGSLIFNLFPEKRPSFPRYQFPSNKTAVKKQDNYSVNDIITVKAEEFLEEHTLTGEVLGVE